MKKIALILLVFFCLPARAFAWDKQPIHDELVEMFKEVEAVFSWHVEDRKTLKEVGDETVQGILS